VLQVAAYHGLDGLRALEGRWRSLADSAPWFHDFDWFVRYFQHGTIATEPGVFLSVEDARGNTVGILPLERRIEKIRRIPFEVWALIGAQRTDVMMLASSADFLCGTHESAEAVLGAAIAHLSRLKGGPAVLQLGRITDKSAAFTACANWPGRLHHYENGGTNWFNVDRSFAALKSELSAKFKANLRNSTNRAFAAGALTFSISGLNSPVYERAFQDFLRVEASGWKAHSPEGRALATNPHKTQKNFLAEVLHRDGDYAPLVARLFLDDKCIAALLGIEKGAVVAVPKIGFDDAYRKLSPGHLLVRAFFECLCENHAIKRVDFIGDAAWPGPWRPTRSSHHWFYLPVRWPRGLLPLSLLRLPSRRK